jgi:Uma2 family endonuclease
MNAMATASFPRGQRFVLHGVAWGTYSRMLRALADRPGVRLTYDRESLELMTPSYEHENQGHLLGRFVIVLTEELGLPVNGGGSTTFRRRRRKRGLEPDECYWIAYEARVRGKTTIDLRLDPPPDLCLEIDVTHSSLNRLGIYAALQFPEIWRLENQDLVCYLLDAGQYVVSPASRAIPGLVVAELTPFLRLAGQQDENAIVRQFRAWVRQQFPTSSGTPPQP